MLQTYRFRAGISRSTANLPRNRFDLISYAARRFRESHRLPIAELSGAHTCRRRRRRRGESIILRVDNRAKRHGHAIAESVRIG